MLKRSMILAAISGVAMVSAAQAAVIVSYTGASPALTGIASPVTFSPAAPALSNADLLQTNVASVVSTGTFGEDGTAGISVLTDGAFSLNTGVFSKPGISSAQNGATITWTLNTSVNTNGYEITQITSFGGWGDFERNDQRYSVELSYVGSPTTFIALSGATVQSNPGLDTYAIRANITDSGSLPLATGVAGVRIAFANPQENNYTGYGEFDVIGSAVAVPEPVSIGVVGLVTGMAMLRRSRKSVA